MFDVFTDEARRAMGMSRDHSLKMGSKYIGSEHVLLGLTDEKSRASFSILALYGIAEQEVLRIVTEKYVDTKKEKAPDQLQFTQNAKLALENSMTVATSLGHKFVCTAHILYGLLGTESCCGIEIIKNLNCEPEVIRSACYQYLNSEVLKELKFDNYSYSSDWTPMEPD